MYGPDDPDTARWLRWCQETRDWNVALEWARANGVLPPFPLTERLAILREICGPVTSDKRPVASEPDTPPE